MDVALRSVRRELRRPRNLVRYLREASGGFARYEIADFLDVDAFPQKRDGFRYNDRFNHSAWLTFIRNRLEVAKVSRSAIKDISVVAKISGNMHLRVPPVWFLQIYG